MDRGIFGTEVTILLFAMKINFPNTFYMLRGNHESRHMTEHFTFREECIDMYDQEVYDLMMEAFDHLPLSAIIDEKYIGMHGGISPDLSKPEQINKIDRFQEVPLDGLFCDLLWADPIDDDLAEKKDWVDNEERECSYLFGKKPAQKLLDSNNLMTIFRAHQVQLEGYKMHRWDGANSFPYVVTIFSAPNYCGYYSNKASVILLDGGNVSIKQCEEATEVPYHLPERMDVFTWSVPFLAEKVTQMLLSVVSRAVDDPEDLATGDAKER